MLKPPDQDILLFRQIQGDDRFALNTLFEDYYQKLCRFAYRYVQNSFEAEECVSDVFVNLWKARKNLMIGTSLKAYLYASVRNSALAVLRKRENDHMDIAELSHELVSHSCEAEEILMLTELQSVVERTIEKLPPRCREVYTLSRIDGLSYHEIGVLLDISENTVENHLVKALHILREVIRQYRKESSGITQA